MTMTPNFKIFLIAITILMAAILLPGCTTVAYETADGTKLTVRKVQIAGEELNVSGTLEGIGTLDIGKKTEDSKATAQALLNGLIEAANP
jgi:uncharacterized protein YceK